MWTKEAGCQRIRAHLLGEIRVDAEEGLDVGNVGHGCLFE